MPSLATEQCTRKYTGDCAATVQERALWLQELPQWTIESHEGVDKLCLHYPLPHYKDGLNVIAQIVSLAEAQQHHPELIYHYGSLTIHWWTHHCKALHKNDFIMAAKVSALLEHL